MSECSFKYDHYTETLTRYSGAGYKVLSLADYASMENHPEKALILRHDVDFSFMAAAEMASLESINGFTASYHFRVHARNYNILDPCNMYKLWDIECQGHDVGLHIGTGESEILNEDLDTSIKRQISILETVKRGAVRSASPHLPSSELGIDSAKKACGEFGIWFAYDDIFFRDIMYTSDSMGWWRDGCFCQWIDRTPRLQVLTHPVWWYSNVPEENY